MAIHEIILATGIPTAIMSIIVFMFQRSIRKRDLEREEREKNTEKLMLFIMQTGRATNVLAEATARAVQRIPDAHCNGDMHGALEYATEIKHKHKNFIVEQGIDALY